MKRLIVTALCVHFGVETLRALLPLLVFGLRDRFGWAALGAIGALRILALSLALFSLTFLAGWLTRRLGRQTMIRACLGLLLVGRLTAQLWQADPLGNLVAMMLALLGFLLFWPPWLSLPADLDNGPVGHRSLVGFGILLGVTLSAALHGFLLTYDAIWRGDPAHLALAGALATLLWLLAFRSAEHPSPVPGPSMSRAWFAFGPFVFLQLLVFLNLARLTVLTGWDQTTAAGFQVLCHGLALAVVAAAASFPGSLARQRIVWTVATALLLLSLLAPWPRGWTAALGLLAGQLGAAALLVATCRGRGPNRGTGPSPPSAPVASHGIGMLMLLFLLFLYYAGYDLTLPFEQVRLLPLAAGLLAAAAWPTRRREGVAHRLPWKPMLTVAALLVGLPWVRPLATVLEPSQPSPVPGTYESAENLVPGTYESAENTVPGTYESAENTVPGTYESAVNTVPGTYEPAENSVPGTYESAENSVPGTYASAGKLRVMTYNLHCGFGTRGDLRLEDQAAVIEAQGPDVVALQEVSRGWIINGGVDMLAWLAQRLNMEYRFAPTADPLWGNATLSRRPIVASRHLDYPSDGSQQIRRGLVETTVEIPAHRSSANGRAHRLTVFNTHFHHRTEDSPIRLGQTRVLLDAWSRRPHSLMMGDLNAIPTSPEMLSLAAAGLNDAVAAQIRSGVLDSAFTFRADRLQRRIDYIWTSADLRTEDVVVVRDTASDHLAIAATVVVVEPSEPATAAFRAR